MGEVLVAKLDTDRNPAMAVRYDIRGIPTLIAVLHGREVGREVGAVPKPRLVALVDRAAAVEEPVGPKPEYPNAEDTGP